MSTPYDSQQVKTILAERGAQVEAYLPNPTLSATITPAVGFPTAGVSFCANETAGQYQPRADAPSQAPFAIIYSGRQTTFAVIQRRR